VTVANYLTKTGDLARIGGAAYLHTLISSVPTAANAGYYAAIVSEQAVLRRLVEAGTRIVQMGYDAEGDTDDVVNSAQAEIYKVTETHTTEDYVVLSDILGEVAQEIERNGNIDGQTAGVPTGFIEFDNLTNGLHPGTMIVIAARPGVGKSTLALTSSVRRRSTTTRPPCSSPWRWARTNSSCDCCPPNPRSRCRTCAGASSARMTGRLWRRPRPASTVPRCSSTIRRTWRSRRSVRSVAGSSSSTISAWSAWTTCS